MISGFEKRVFASEKWYRDSKNGRLPTQTESTDYYFVNTWVEKAGIDMSSSMLSTRFSSASSEEARRGSKACLLKDHCLLLYQHERLWSPFNDIWRIFARLPISPPKSGATFRNLLTFEHIEQITADWTNFDQNRQNRAKSTLISDFNIG